MWPGRERFLPVFPTPRRFRAKRPPRGGNLAQAMKSAGLWQSKEQAFKRALARGGLPDFERLMAACARLDRLSKGRGDGDPWCEMERLIAGIVAPRALPA